MDSTDFCRVCAGTNSLIDIFSPGNEELQQIVKTYAKIEIKRTDKLPKKICEPCRTGLQIGYNLLKLGKANERKYKEGTSLHPEDEEEEAYESVQEEEEQLEEVDENEGTLEELMTMEELVDEESMAMEEVVDEEFFEGESEDNPQELEVIGDEELQEEYDDIDQDQITRAIQEESFDLLNSDLNEEEMAYINSLQTKSEKYRNNARLLKIINNTTNSDEIEKRKTDFMIFHKKTSSKPNHWKQLIEPIFEYGTRKYVCKLCDFKSNNIEAFVEHASEHEDDKMYFCRLRNCNKFTIDWPHLRVHIRFHFLEEKYFCDLCDFSAGRKHNFTRHVELCTAKHAAKAQESENQNTAKVKDSEKKNPPKVKGSKSTSKVRKSTSKGRPNRKRTKKTPQQRKSKIRKIEVSDEDQDFESNDEEMLNFNENYEYDDTDTMLEEVQQSTKQKSPKIGETTSNHKISPNVSQHSRSSRPRTKKNYKFDDEDIESGGEIIEIDSVSENPEALEAEITDDPLEINELQENLSDSSDTDERGRNVPKRTPTKTGSVNFDSVVDYIEQENSKFCYKGSPKQKSTIIEFHKKACKEPFTWKQLVVPEYGTSMFKCKLCNFQDGDIQKFPSHTQKHKDVKLYSCRMKECKAYFKDWKSLETHIETHFGGKTYFCEICWSSFKKQEYLDRHIQQNHAEADEPVEQSDEDYVLEPEDDDDDSLYSNTQNKLEKSYRCDICDRDYSLKSSLVRHNKEKHNKVRDKSEKTSERDESLERGYGESFEDYPLDPLHSKLNDSDQQSEFDREAEEENEPDSEVEEDDLKYLDSLEEDKVLEYHQRVSKEPKKWEQLVIPIKEGKFTIKCKVCGMKHTSQGTFMTHAQKHTGELTYKCRLFNCTKAYTTWYSLQRHLITHCNKRKFQCTMCGSTFKHQKGFNIHLRVEKCGGLLEVIDGNENKANSTLEKSLNNSGNAEEADESLVNSRDQDSRDDTVDNEKELYSGKITLENLIEFHKQFRYDPKFWREMVERTKIDGVYTLKCKLCDYSTKYSNVESFISHASGHTGDKKYLCRVRGCNEATRTWKLLIYHFKTRHPSTDGNDSIPNASNKEDDEIIKEDELFYFGEITEEKLVKFHKKFKDSEPQSWKDIAERVKVNGVLTVKCKLCDYTARASNLQSFISHTSSHTGERPFICRVPGCSGSFRAWKHLLNHFKCHRPARNYVCDICGASFKIDRLLINHRKRHEECKRFKKPLEELSRDLSDEDDDAILDKEDPSLEEIIEFHKEHPTKFNSWKKMTEIVQVGIFGYNYKCLQCGERNQLKDDHMRHTLDHTGAKPWKCKVVNCGKRFLSRKHLSSHLESHCTQKNYVCEYCNSAFASKGRLQQHSVIHKSDKLYDCRYCSGSFFQECSRRYHEQSHKPGKDILKNCELCENKYLHTNMLKYHMKQDHGVEVILAPKKEVTEKGNKDL